jgi:hypothetical protein
MRILRSSTLLNSKLFTLLMLMLHCYAGAVPPTGVHPLLPTATVHGYSVRHPGLPVERGRDRVHGARPPLPGRPGGRQLLGSATPSQGPGGLLDHQPSLHWLFCRWDRIFFVFSIFEKVCMLNKSSTIFKAGFYSQIIHLRMKK